MSIECVKPSFSRRTIDNRGAVLIALLWLILLPVQAQQRRADSLAIQDGPIHQVEFDLYPQSVFETKDFFKGVNAQGQRIDQALSLHLKYAFQFPQHSHLGRLYPHTYQGVGLSYNTFFNSTEMGNPVALYLFQGSRIAQLWQHLSLDYEWHFGLSWGWKPYDGATNHFNTVVGTRSNAYIHLGLLLAWQMSQEWKLTMGMGVTHYSNGNTHYPNSGVNVWGANVGVTRLFGKALAAGEAHVGSTPQVKPHVSWDLLLYGAMRSKGIVSDRIVVPGSYGVAGFYLSPMYNFNKYFRGGLSLDGQFDESANIKVKMIDDYGNYEYHRASLDHQIGLGLSLRGELVMPIFTINCGIGHNVIYHGDDLDGFYQELGLKMQLVHSLYLHVGYRLAEFHDPQNLMFGIGYRFHDLRQ